MFAKSVLDESRNPAWVWGRRCLRGCSIQPQWKQSRTSGFPCFWEWWVNGAAACGRLEKAFLWGCRTPESPLLPQPFPRGHEAARGKHSKGPHPSGPQKMCALSRHKPRDRSVCCTCEGRLRTAPPSKPRQKLEAKRDTAKLNEQPSLFWSPKP